MNGTARQHIMIVTNPIKQYKDNPGVIFDLLQECKDFISCVTCVDCGVPPEYVENENCVTVLVFP